MSDQDFSHPAQQATARWNAAYRADFRAQFQSGAVSLVVGIPLLLWMDIFSLWSQSENRPVLILAVTVCSLVIIAATSAWLARGTANRQEKIPDN